ncbi:MAG: hypothetical protein V1746_05725 [bacterium]
MDAAQVEPSFEREKQIPVFERTKRLSLFLTVSLAINLTFGLGVFVAAIFLFLKFISPPFGVISLPFVATQDHGYIMAHDVELFRQRTDLIYAFLKMVTEGLLNGEPLGYNASFLQPYVSPVVLKRYSDVMEERTGFLERFNRRQIWNVQEVRRYYEKGFSKYMVVAVKGERLTYEDIESEGVKIAGTKIEPTLFIIHLLTAPYSPANPWGLYVAAIREEYDPVKIHKIWENTKDLAKTRDLRGQSILPAPQKRELD